MVAGILERGDELRQIAQAARDAAAGLGSVVLVSGEAGIGKSSLVAGTRSQLSPESRLLVGHCDDLATARPLGPFRDLSDSVGVELTTALASATDREALLRALWAELNWTRHATVLAIEDIHWADHATLDVLRYLVRRIEQLPVVLMLTYRDDEVPRDHPLRQLLGLAAASARTRRLPLERLSAEAVAQLCTGAALDASGVFTVTAGNPYYVTEVLAAGTSDPVPLTVVDAVLAKVHTLDPASRVAVEQLSVLPAAAERWLVEELLPDGISSVAVAEERGLLSAGSHGVAFRHELTRRAIADALPGAQRVVLEGRVLAALRARPDPEPARLVHHASMAGDIEAIAQYAPIAAREAARSGAHREAAMHYRLAIEHSAGLADAERADLIEGRAIECYTAGIDQPGVAADEAEVVRLRRELGDPAALGASLRWLSRFCWWYGDPAGARAAADDAVTVLAEAVLETGAAPGGPIHRLLAMAYSNQSQLDMLHDRYEQAVEVSSRAIELARASGDAATLTHALCNLGTSQWQLGDRAGGIESLAESRAVALAAREFEHACRAYVNTIWTYLDEFLPLPAAELLPAALEIAEENEQFTFRDYLLVARGRTENAAGRFQDAISSSQRALDSPGPIRCAALIVINQAAVRTGRSDPAMLAEMWRLAAHLDELQRTGPAAAVLAEAAWLSGGADALREPGLHDLLVEVRAEALARRRWSTVAEIGYWLGDDATEPPMPRNGYGYALQTAGDWRAAARTWAADGYRYEYAAALAESPRPEDALRALEILDSIEAAPLAARIRRTLRTRGVPRVPRGPAAATRGHAAGLTPRQAEVFDLLRAGLTNAEIAGRLVISERTADHHVSAVLAKLGARSRTELRADMGTRSR